MFILYSFPRLPAASKSAVSGSAETEQPEDLLAANSAQTRALLTFARSADPSARYTVSAEGDSFTLTLQKEEDFAVFSSEKTYAASALSDLPQTAVGGLLLDIE